MADRSSHPIACRATWREFHFTPHSPISLRQQDSLARLSSRRNVFIEFGDCIWPQALNDSFSDSRDAVEIINRVKRTVSDAVIDDALRQSWPDCRQKRKLRGGRGVDVDEGSRRYRFIRRW